MNTKEQGSDAVKKFLGIKQEMKTREFSDSSSKANYIWERLGELTTEDLWDIVCYVASE